MKNVWDKLLQEINCDKKPSFSNIILSQADLDNKTKIFELVFENNQIIPFEDMYEFLYKLNTNFKYRTNFKFNILSPIYEEEQIKKYVNWIIGDYLKKKDFSRIFTEHINKVSKDGEVDLVFNHTTDYNYAGKLLPNLIRIMKKFGFENIIFKLSHSVTESILEEEKKKYIKQMETDSKSPIRLSVEMYGVNKKKYLPLAIRDIYEHEGYSNVEVAGQLFSLKEVVTKSGMSIFTFGITDFSEAIYIKMFIKEEKHRRIFKEFRDGTSVTIKGRVQEDSYLRQKVIMADSIKNTVNKHETREDRAIEKRVELSFRTRMSTMDGIVSPSQIIDRLEKWGHKSFAVVDSGSLQSFPDIYNGTKNSNIKPIYGISIEKIDVNSNAIYNYKKNKDLLNDEYVVFDLETTGLSPEENQIIEFGAVIVKNNQIINKKQLFIKPTKPIPTLISNLTGITDEMVVNAPNQKEGLQQIHDFIGDRTLIAHNANFDFTFLKTNFKDHKIGSFSNPIIDTLITSRIAHPDSKRFRLETVAKKYNVEYDSTISHRGDYDAEVLANIWTKQVLDLIQMGIKSQKDLYEFKNDRLYEKAFGHEISIIAKNQSGLKKLFQITSKSLTDDLHKNPTVFIQELQNQKDVLIGSGGIKSKLVDLIFYGSKEQIKNEIALYDYIEVQPPKNFIHSVSDDFPMERIKWYLKFIINEAKKQNKIVVATGDVRYLDKYQKVYHEVYINAKGLGGVRHYLFKFNDPNPIYPDQFFLTTEEMLKEFAFLKDKELIDEIVVKNTNKIADSIDKIKIIKDKLYTPTMEKVDDKLEKLVYKKAYEEYGNPLPEIIEKRIKREMEPIKKYGFSVIYWISHLLVGKSLADGYLVGSRGSVGSSLVATLADITEVNPLDPHYICSSCKYSEFSKDKTLNSGYDLPKKNCPKCGTQMNSEGQKIPFETFLGFDGDKVPDIDLNFSGDYQPIVHQEVKNIFGDSHSFRAGTISTVADKTAYGYVKAWAEETAKDISKPFIEFLAKNVAGTKRTTGQHPGGIIVIPKEMDVNDFSPVNFPANDKNSSWKTTHFDFHAIHDNVLKLDLLGHDDPTAIKQLEKMTGIDVKKDIPFNDNKVISLFSSTESLNIKPEDINGESTGAMGIPEFGTTFVRRMLKSAKVSSFGDLIAVSGLSHGTDVWSGNAEQIIKENGLTLSDVISCRDNIMTDLMNYQVDASESFNIMERVRKGNGLLDHQETLLHEKDVPSWYIDSLKKIKYMFPKAHATAYVMMAWRIAWFKLYYPKEYYATYFSTRADSFDLLTIMGGKDKIQEKLKEYKNRNIRSRGLIPLTNKEISLIPILEMANEAIARGIKINNISLEKSKVDEWCVDSDGSLIPPFVSVDGLGASVAESIIAARDISPFTTLEDFKKRTNTNITSIKLMKSIGIFDHIHEQNQISLNDFFSI